MEWVEKKSSELYVSSSGLSKSSDQFGYGYPFLSYKDVFNNYYAPDKLSTLVNSTEKDRMKCSVKQGDVFLTRTSETTDELGMSCVALHDYVNATFNGFTKRLRPLTDEIEPKYAAYYFRSPYFRSQCISLASLITRASLNDGMIRRLKIRYPLNRKVQEKIGEILYTYDTLIENNTKRIRLLEKMAENLYKEWFVRFRFPGHENVEMENGLPKGWKVMHIKDIATLKSGFAFKSEWFVSEGCGVAKIKDIGETFMDLSNLSYVCEDNCKKAQRFILKEGMLTIALTGATIGKISIVPKHSTCIYTNQRLGKFFVENQPIDSLPFLYCLFSQESMVQDIINLANSSSAQPNISPEQINNIKFTCDEKIIDKYNQMLKGYFQIMIDLHCQNSLLARQRYLLLPRLMSGKLEVKVKA